MRNSKISYVQFISLYNEGMSDGKIGEALGVKKWEAKKYRDSLGFPPNFLPKIEMSEEEKETMKELHGKDLTIKEIARTIGRSYPVVLKYCQDMDLDTSLERGQSLRREAGRQKRETALLNYLKEHGPTPQGVLGRQLKIARYHFPRFARHLFDSVERFKFKVGANRGRGGTKHGGAEIYGELQKMGPIFALRNDERVITFVARFIPFEVNTKRDAQTLVMHLKKALGTERAREVVEKLGYKYLVRPERSPRKKFTDEQLKEYYDKGLVDRNIAEILGVTTSAVGVRRRKLNLPAHGRWRAVHCPKCGHEFKT